ncbi:hypothetical protein JCM11641_003838 [Rhodosporidiobolus odoratus]
MLPPAPKIAGQPQEEVQVPPAPVSPRGGIIAGARSVASTVRLRPSSSFLEDRADASTSLKALHIAQLALNNNPTENGDEKKTQANPLISLLEQLKEGTLVRDAKTIVSGLSQAGEPLDDRRLLLEQVIELLSTLPEDSPIGTSLQNRFVRLLWNDLPHPPTSFVGESRFRSADGSGNNIFMPSLGAAGQPYARDVPAVHAQPNNLPEPSLVFDALMKRKEFTPHPSGISSLLFAFATLITHSCFNTSREDPNINDASSYLDLSPLYGNTEEEQLKIRTGFEGEIYPDVLASQRLFLMPPATIALGIVFSRNHNWIVRKLVEINQNGKFPQWESLDDDERKAQDEELFQTARLINCGWFQNVIFQDYIRCILHVNATMSTWSLVPTGEIKSLIDGTLARGTGNAVSVEFNLLYRWHMAIGEKDEQWLEGLMRKFLGSDKAFDDLDRSDFRKVYEGLSAQMGEDPTKWCFGDLKRTGEDGAGPFRDEDIVRVLTEATDNIAGAFKARGVPAVMKIIDVMGMATSRMKWNCATLNEFRTFLNLTEYKTFEEWNPDPEIAETARRLYGDVSHLELMPGLACEQAKPSMEGSGLCPGYTISRAILSDAAALVRGDRYLTSDYTAGNLTSFQWKDLQPELDNGAFGGSISKLLLRHFPQFYTFNSTYALFPFTTPHITGEILKNLQIAERYNASRPVAVPDWAILRSHKAAKEVFNDQKTYKNIYGAHVKALQDRYPEPAFLSHFEAFDTPARREEAKGALEAALFPPHWAQLLLAQVGEATKQQISQQGWAYEKGGRMRLDVVNDLVVPVAMNYLAKTLGLPMKTDDKYSFGLFTPQCLYEMLSNCWTFVYANFDPTVGYKLREKAKKDAEILRSVIEWRLNQVNGTPSALHTLAADVRETLTGKSSGKLILSDRAFQFYERFLKSSNRPVEELAGLLQTTAVSFVTVVSAVANIVDCVLRPENKNAHIELSRAAQMNAGVVPDATIGKVVEEALRLQPAVTGFARRATVDTTVLDGEDGNERVRIEKDQLVWVDMAAANRDQKFIKDPNKFSLDHQPGVYMLTDRIQGITNRQGESLNSTFALAIIRELFMHSNVARAGGKAGDLGAMKGPLGIRTYLRHDNSSSTFPTGMQIEFDSNKVARA